MSVNGTTRSVAASATLEELTTITRNKNIDAHYTDKGIYNKKEVRSPNRTTQAKTRYQ